MQLLMLLLLLTQLQRSDDDDDDINDNYALFNYADFLLLSA